MDESVFKDKKIAYYTLGCKLNFSETATLDQQLRALGAHVARSGEQADLCIVNTCSVTEVADRKCRQAIHRLVRRYPDAFFVVTGCYAQLKPAEVASIPGVDLVVGTEEKGRLLSLVAAAEKKPQAQVVAGPYKSIRSYVPSCSRGNRTRYFLKIQDGCDYFCTYCTIPFARGRSRNGSIASLVAEARQAAADGGKEIVITGVNIGDYGKTTGERFIDLLRQLDQVEGIARYRISSLEPDLLTDDVIEFVAQSRAFMPHFHIPLQSGADEVLRLMHRRYDAALFADKVRRIRQLMPQAFIGVDVIVGARGETPALFEESCRFIKSLPVTQLHVFPYSERPGTKALNIPLAVSADEKHDRSQRLIALSEDKRREFYSAHIGQEAVVLMEKSSRGKPMHGFTDNYIRVEMPYDERLDNQLVNVRLGDFTPDFMALQAGRK